MILGRAIEVWLGGRGFGVEREEHPSETTNAKTLTKEKHFQNNESKMHGNQINKETKIMKKAKNPKLSRVKIQKSPLFYWVNIL